MCKAIISWCKASRQPNSGPPPLPDIPAPPEQRQAPSQGEADAGAAPPAKKRRGAPRAAPKEAPANPAPARGKASTPVAEPGECSSRAGLEQNSAKSRRGLEAEPETQEDPRTILGRVVGPFRFTPKQHYQVSGGKFGGLEASCPYHKKSASAGCRKWFGIKGPSIQDIKEAVDAALTWCAQARHFERQRYHIAFNPAYGASPAANVTRLLPIFSEPRPVGVFSDQQLDADEARADAAPKAKPKAKAKSGRRRAGPTAPVAEGETKAASDAESDSSTSSDSSSSSSSDS